MGSRKKLLAEALENPFSIQNFTRFIGEYLCKTNFSKKPGENISDIDENTVCSDLNPEAFHTAYSDMVSEFRFIAEFSCCSENTVKGCQENNFDLSKDMEASGANLHIAVIAVRLKEKPISSLNNSRERCFIGKLLDLGKQDAAIVAFYMENQPEWTLSFVRPIKPAYSDSLEYTPIKRVSWPVGTASKGKIAGTQLFKFLGKTKLQPCINELELAFSLDYFTKRFIKNCLNTSKLFQYSPFIMRENEPLEQVLAVDPGMLGKLFESQMNSKDRKSRGTFYTPREIVQFMCRESLAYYLSNTIDTPFEEIWTFFQYAEGLHDRNYKLSELSLSKLLKIDSELEQVKIFDPAAGSGAFLLGMLSEIVKIRSFITGYLPERFSGKQNAALEGLYALKENTIRNSLFAADIDSDAIEITKLRLWYALVSDCVEERMPDMTEFYCNIVCTDSLEEITDDGPGVQKYDIVIGNPPYISAVEEAKSGNGLRQALKQRFPLLKGAFDIYTAFLLNGIRQTTDKGVYCWIVPNKLLVSGYAVPVLEHLKLNGLKHSISISGLEVFSHVGVYPVIVTGNKVQQLSQHYREYCCDRLEALQFRHFRHKTKPKTYQSFADFNIMFASGAAGFQAEALSTSISDTHSKGAIPFAVSGSIDKYTVHDGNVRYMGTTYRKAFITKNNKIADSKWRFWCREKIIIAGLTKELEAAYCSEPLALGVGTYAIYDFGDFDPYYLLGILNSSFMSLYLSEKFSERHLAGGYLSISKSTLEQLPLVEADPVTQENIAHKAREIQRLSKLKLLKDSVSDVIDRLIIEIDASVEQLFCEPSNP